MQMVSAKVVQKTAGILVGEGKPDMTVWPNEVRRALGQPCAFSLIGEWKLKGLNIMLARYGRHIRIGIFVGMQLPPKFGQWLEIVQVFHPGQSVATADIPGATF